MLAITDGLLVFPEEIRRGVLLLEGDRILGCAETVPDGAEVLSAEGLYVGPGLIDEHLHGFSKGAEAYDIVDSLRDTALAHLRAGTTALLPSPSYSFRMDRYLSVIEESLALMEQGDTPIVGIHLEGPYINPRQGAGRKYAWKYTDEALTRLLEAGKGRILTCTYAPEMPHGPQVEALLSRYGIIPAIGHTQADPESLCRAVRAGAKLATHLYDGMGHYLGIHAFDLTGDPQDSVSAVLLSLPGLAYELICDSRGIHATPSSIRLAYRVAGEDGIILISDCTCYKRGKYRPEDFPAEDIRSAPDLNITPNGTVFGSRLTVADCAANFKKVTGADMRVCFKCASTNSARVLGLEKDRGSLLPGRLADLVFADGDFGIRRVLFHGKEVPHGA